MKILLVVSSGGHLYMAMRLKPWWSRYKRIWVTKKDAFSTSVLKKEKVIEGNFPEQRNIINFFKNLFLAVKVVLIEKPDVIFSTGAGVAPPFFLIAKLFGKKTIFLEAFVTIGPTLSGKISYPMTNLFLIQDHRLQLVYKNSKYVGKLL